ncbi:MAG: N-acetyltransferase family protein [Vulcanimicrobiaceae bacterium]
MLNDASEALLSFRRMTSGDRPEAFALLSELFARDAYYRDSSLAYGASQDNPEANEAALGRALSLYIDRPDYGFVWLGFDDDRPVACAAVSYAISASLGDVVARLDCFMVAPRARRHGIGSATLEALARELKGAEIARLDASAHLANDAAKQFFIDLGFLPLREERFALGL